MNKKKRQAERSKELNRLIRLAALELTGRTSIEAAGEHAKVSGAAIRWSIRRGEFSVGLASALEDAFGRDLLKREVLCSKLAEGV